MKKVEVIEGVVAEYEGKYWGTLYDDGRSKTKGFVDICDAEISNPEFCTKPTDKTWNPKNTGGYNPEYELLKQATLVRIIKIVSTEIEICQ